MDTVNERTQKAFMSAIAEQIAKRFDGNVAKAARAWGVPNDNLHKWLRGDRTPRLKNLIELYTKSLEGLSPEEIMSVEEMDRITSLKNFFGVEDQESSVTTPVINTPVTPEPMKTVPDQATDQIPVYNINCATPTREEASPISHMTPCPQFPEADFAIYMEDYSVMKNSLPEGSVIGVKTIDHRSKFIKSGHIYLMWWEHEGLVVRYAYLDQSTKEVKCMADHDDQEKFPPQFFPVEQAQQFVVGRVVWCMARV